MLSSFLAELQRRKVIRVAVGYAVVGFGIIEGVDLIFPRLALPDWAVDYILWVVLLGFPVAVVVSWFVDITPSGIERTRELTAEERAGRARATRSPRGWILGATGALMVVASAFVFVPRADSVPFSARDWIVVTDLENHTEEEVFDRSLYHALAVALDQSQYVNVFPRNRVQEVLQRMQRDSVPGIDLPLALEIAAREDIQAVLAFSISELGGRYLLATRLVDPYTGNVVRSRQVEAEGKDRVLDALDELATRVRRDLGESLLRIRGRAVPLARATTPSIEALKAFTDGSAAWSQGRWQEARTLWSRALELDPGFAWASASLGLAAQWLDDSAGAEEEHFDRALSQLDRVTEKERLWIMALAAEGEAAVTAYQTYLQQYPDDRDGWYNLGNGLRVEGRMEEAMEAYRRSLAVDSMNPWAHTNLGVGYDVLGRIEDAHHHFERSFELSSTRPTDWRGDVNRISGFVLVKLGDTIQARERFERLLAGDAATRANGLRSLALLDMYRGRHTAALERLGEAVTLNERSEAALSEFRNRMYRAQAFRTLGWADALGRELDRGQALAEAGGWEPNWTVHLALHQLAAGDVQRARDWLDRWIESGQDQGRLAWPVSLLRGEIALVEGDYPAAVAALERAAQLDRPVSGLVMEALARAYYANGQRDRAVAAFEETLRLQHLGWEPQESWVLAHYRLGLVLEEMGRHERARHQFERFLELWGDGDPGLEGVDDARSHLTSGPGLVG